MTTFHRNHMMPLQGWNDKNSPLLMYSLKTLMKSLKNEDLPKKNEDSPKKSRRKRRPWVPIERLTFRNSVRLIAFFHFWISYIEYSLSKLKMNHLNNTTRRRIDRSVINEGTKIKVDPCYDIEISPLLIIKHVTNRTNHDTTCTSSHDLFVITAEKFSVTRKTSTWNLYLRQKKKLPAVLTRN